MMDYNQLFLNQPIEVAQTLPESFRAQLEAGTDKIVLDEDFLDASYQGGELIRIKAVDFQALEEDDYDDEGNPVMDEDGFMQPKYVCRLVLSGKIQPEYDEEGVLEENGNPFFSCLYPFRNHDGSRTNGRELPGEDSQWLPGFKSLAIRHDDLLSSGAIDEATKQYLDQQARAWVQCTKDNPDLDQQAPYLLEDENGNSLINSYAGLLTTNYMAFALSIRPPRGNAQLERYGIYDVEFEPGGLSRLATATTVKVASERRTKPAKPTKTYSKTSSHDIEQANHSSNQRFAKSRSRNRKTGNIAKK